MKRSPGDGVAGIDAAAFVDAAFRQSATAMAITDAAGNILEVNPALSQLLGSSADILSTRSLGDLTLAEDLPATAEGLQRMADGPPSELSLGVRFLTPVGDVVRGRLTCIPIRDAAGQLLRILAQVEDLGERTDARAAARRGSHDQLTGLANRRLLHERLRAALADPRRSARELALLVVKLDGFEHVTSGLGDAAAELILDEVARRLVAAARGRDTVARLGDDEFAVLAPDTTPEAAITMAVDIRHLLSQTFWALGNPAVVLARVGVVTAPAHGRDAETLIRRASEATSRAKSLSGGWATQVEGPDATDHEELRLLADLRAAINEGDIGVVYQPVVDGEGQTHGVEALARWHHRERGAVPPDQFIVLAEQNGLIATLTSHVVTRAVEQAAQWSATVGPVPVSVNVSGALLGHPAVVDTVAGIAASAGLAPELLTLEITETALADGRNPAIMSNLDALRATGVRVSIDDFGTGYSSLAYLQRLRVDELKIDRSFIIDLESEPRTQRIVRSIVDLAHSLELVVVAEGVEDEGAASRLLQLGVDYLQGFFIATPAGSAPTSAWLSARSPTPSRTRARADGRSIMDVLVIDDHPGVRAALRERLTQRSHRVEEARNGLEALDRVRHHMPDLIILNHRPGVSGVEIAPRLREAHYNGPILLFTGSAPEDMAKIRFPMDVWPVSKADDKTLMALIDGYAAQSDPRRG